MTKHQSHVLVIEDNPGDADLVRLRLVEGRSDLEVNCVDRLSAGLEALNGQPPSVVLLDLNLPDSRGAETFRKVLTKAPGVPVVVLSGQDDEELAAKAVHQGVQDYLVKGAFDSKQLARAMRYAVERQALLTSLDMSRKQQLKFKDEFLSHVSHELRTPLTCIHQFVTLLLDGLAGPLTFDQRGHLETILRSVHQLRSMIADLLEATRAETGKISVEPRCIQIERVIRQAVTMLSATADEKRIGLEAGVDTRIPLVHADPDRLQQVLMNLIDNAIKFTPPDGSVMVKAWLMDADPGFVYISVADTGRGISPEARALIFERLYQDPNAVDNSRKGLGLGLYITKELVRLHGGRIWVESQVGHGSAFTFTLPLFSLSKLLFPTITDQGRLRSAVSLITVEIAPLPTCSSDQWHDARRQCLQLLKASVYRGEDVVLPAPENHGQQETFLIVAPTDEQGARAMEKRISEQIERHRELRATCRIKVMHASLPLPDGTLEGNLEAQVLQVADRISSLAMPAFACGPTSQNAVEENPGLTHRPETTKEQMP
jgi:signal transduction histidine kinase